MDLVENVIETELESIGISIYGTRYYHDPGNESGTEMKGLHR